MNLETQWIVGFVDGEGCFHIGISKHKEISSGYQIIPEFVVTQHKRNISVLYGIKKVMKNIGVVRKNKATYQFKVRKLSELKDVVLPFFEKHSLKTDKKIDFLGFRDVVHMMLNKEHLTPEGFQKIQAIQSRTNRKQLPELVYSSESTDQHSEITEE